MKVRISLPAAGPVYSLFLGSTQFVKVQTGKMFPIVAPAGFPADAVRAVAMGLKGARASRRFAVAARYTCQRKS